MACSVLVLELEMLLHILNCFGPVAVTIKLA